MRLNSREAELFALFKQHGARPAVTDMHQQAKIATDKGEHRKAAACYAALAHFMPHNQQLALRTARSYQKATALEDAGRWYLEAAERYARMHQTTQAVATLRLYREVLPGEHRGPKRIFELCREKGQTASGMFEFLSPKDQAAQRLRAEDIFATFDDVTFAEAFEAMEYIELQPGEHLSSPGEPARAIFIIVQGRLQGFLNLKGERTLLGSLGAGEICCAVPYFSGRRCTSEIIAVEAAGLLALPYQVLDALRERSAEFREHLDDLYRNHILIKQLALAPLLDQLEAGVRRQIARQMTFIAFKAGETIFVEHEQSCDLYLVRSGTVALNIKISGQEQLYKTMKTGALLGEVSIATRGVRSLSARAISDCRLAKLPAQAYREWYETDASLPRLLQARVREQAEETRMFVRQCNMVEGDDTCELLLRDIWGDDSA